MDKLVNNVVNPCLMTGSPAGHHQNNVSLPIMTPNHVGAPTYTRLNPLDRHGGTIIDSY